MPGRGVDPLPCVPWLNKADLDELLEAVIQYRDDLKRPPTGDSIERRLAMVNAAIRKATGAAA